MLAIWSFIFILSLFLFWYGQSEKVKAPQFLNCKRSCQRYLFRVLWDAGFYPEVNYSIGDYEVDIAFPYSKVALECGWNKWDRNDLIQYKSRKKQQNLVEQGWKYIQLSPEEIYGRPKRCVEKVHQVVSRIDLMV
ncbi:MAG TPA: hypothetical protein VJ824_06315 [Bacillota bacterium]|nr:hypothetical protein [Bacillota bacterium]